MRNLSLLDKYRIVHPLWGAGDEKSGAFMIQLAGSKLPLAVIASTGGGWDHVSVSTRKRTPTWEEMQRIKELFFEDEETAMQLHPPSSKYINNHPYCLHIWRPQTEKIPMPKEWMV